MNLDSSASPDRSPSRGRLEALPPIINNNFARIELFNKLKSILDSDLRSEEVEVAWTHYFDLVMEPCDWTAVWCPSPQSAEAFGCLSGREGACLVEVIDVVSSECRAEVDILKPGEGWTNPPQSSISVHLSELYPVKDQENTELNIDRVGEALDLYRFFYKHIWRPWDAESQVDDWPDTVLKNRIQLAFDLASKSGHWGVARQLETLASEARDTVNELTDLEATAGELVSDEELDEELAGRFSQLFLRKAEIKKEAELLEDPYLRQFVRTGKQHQRRTERRNTDPGVLLVWNSGSVQEMVDVTARLIQDGGSTQLHVVPSLQHAVDISVSKDRIVFAHHGVHLLESLRDLSRGGKLEGSTAININELMSSKHQLTSSKNQLTNSKLAEKAFVICPEGVTDVFLDISGDFEINNIVLDLPSSLNIGIIVRNGKLTLNNTLIQGCGVGIKLLAGAEVVLTGSGIVDCTTAILQDSSSTLHLGNTQILDCATKIEKRSIETESADMHKVGKLSTLLNYSQQGSPMMAVRRLDFGGVRGRSSSTPKCQAESPTDDRRGLISGFANSSQESEITTFDSSHGDA